MLAQSRLLSFQIGHARIEQKSPRELKQRLFSPLRRRDRGRDAREKKSSGKVAATAIPAAKAAIETMTARRFILAMIVAKRAAGLKSGAMRIPEEFIRDLAARADLAAIVGARVQLRRSGKRLLGLCPFHPEKTPSFHVSPEKGMFHCFGCGAHGDAIGFFMQKENLDFIAAVEALARECGVEVPRESSPRELASAPLTAVLRAATAHFMGELAKSEKTLEYVRQRGIGEETASAFRLGFAPPGWERIVKKLGREHSPKILVEAGLARASEEGRVYDYFRDRLMFPILSPRREPLGFGGRALGDDPAKYLNSPETPLFHKSRVLFGLPQAIDAVRQTRRVIVVEGYMDVVGLFENGIRNGVATMGTAATEAQAAILTRLADEIVFAFDGDDAGRRAARKALENFLPALRDGKSVSFMMLPKGEDPDSVARAQGGDGFLRLLKNAVGLGDFWVDSLWGEFESLPTAEARKSAFLRRGGEMLRAVREAPYLRQALLARLAEKASIPAAGIETAMRNARHIAAPAAAPTRRARQSPKHSRADFVAQSVFSDFAFFVASPRFAASNRRRAVAARRFAARGGDDGVFGGANAAGQSAQFGGGFARQPLRCARRRSRGRRRPARRRSRTRPLARRLRRAPRKHARRAQSELRRIDRKGASGAIIGVLPNSIDDDQANHRQASLPRARRGENRNEKNRRQNRRRRSDGEKTVSPESRKTGR